MCPTGSEMSKVVRTAGKQPGNPGQNGGMPSAAVRQEMLDNMATRTSSWELILGKPKVHPVSRLHMLQQ